MSDASSLNERVALLRRLNRAVAKATNFEDLKATVAAFLGRELPPGGLKD